MNGNINRWMDGAGDGPNKYHPYPTRVTTESPIHTSPVVHPLHHGFSPIYSGWVGG